MKNFPLVISFYTTQTLYQLEIQNLIASCEQLGIEIVTEGVDSFGSWELNCAYKPFFILEKLKKYERPLLWVDADGVFRRKPFDFSVFNCDFSVRIEEELLVDHPSKVVSSTIYVDYKKETIDLLRLWCFECQRQLTDKERKEEFWDQIALREAIFTMPHSAHVKSLPLAYAKIFDHPKHLIGQEEIIIEHYQASRRLKKIVNELK